MKNLSSLLYTYSRNLELNTILLICDPREKLAALGRWSARRGYRGRIPRWFVEEYEEAVLQVWKDEK